MKLHRVATVLLLCIALLVAWNTVYITKTLDRYIAELDALPTPQHVRETEEALRALRADYEAFEAIFSLTVSHEDLADVRMSFADLAGAIEADDRAAFLQAKSRLQDTLRHLRRLSAFDLYSIF